jgi:succinate dehydrogenase/fumarate reductase flavoprotein subunit
MEEIWANTLMALAAEAPKVPVVMFSAFLVWFVVLGIVVVTRDTFYPKKRLPEKDTLSTAKFMHKLAKDNIHVGIVKVITSVDDITRNKSTVDKNQKRIEETSKTYQEARENLKNAKANRVDPRLESRLFRVLEYVIRKLLWQ